MVAELTAAANVPSDMDVVIVAAKLGAQFLGSLASAIPAMSTPPDLKPRISHLTCCLEKCFDCDDIVELADMLKNFCTRRNLRISSFSPKLHATMHADAAFASSKFARQQ